MSIKKRYVYTPLGGKGMIVGSCSYNGKTVLYVVWDDNPNRQESYFETNNNGGVK